MRKGMVYGFILLSMILIVAFTSTPSLGAVYTNVGVRNGDWADYNLSESYVNYTRLHVYVYGVVGTVVTLNRTYYDADGVAVFRDQISGDVVTGAGDFMWSWWLIAAGLGKDDPIWSGSTYKINRTEAIDVAGVSRSVNHWDYIYFSIPQYVEWDQATGLVVQASFIAIIVWFNLTMTATSLWSPAQFPLTTVLIIGEGVAILALIGIVVIQRRKMK